MHLEMLPAVKELDTRIRGRLIYQVIRRLEESAEGSFIFAGWVCTYTCDGETVVVGIQEFVA